MTLSLKMSIATGIIVPILVAIIISIPKILENIEIETKAEKDLNGTYLCVSRKLLLEGGKPGLETIADYHIEVVVTKDKLFINGPKPLPCSWETIINKDDHTIELYSLGNKENIVCKRRRKIDYRLEDDVLYWVLDRKLVVVSPEFGEGVEKIKWKLLRIEEI